MISLAIIDIWLVVHRLYIVVQSQSRSFKASLDCSCFSSGTPFDAKRNREPNGLYFKLTLAQTCHSFGGSNGCVSETIANESSGNRHLRKHSFSKQQSQFNLTPHHIDVVRFKPAQTLLQTISCYT